MAGSGEQDGRRLRSQRTRATIAETARDLFVEHGYVATTIESVAEHAGVAVQTVYYVFGTKRNLLAAVLDTTVAGGAESAPVVEQPWVEEIRGAADATTAIERIVAASVAIVSRTAPVYEAVRQAAADPDVGALLTGNRAARRADQRRVMETFAAGGHLRTGLDVDTAADVYYGLLNEELFRLFVVDCRWDVDRFRQWATAVMIDQLTARP